MAVYNVIRNSRHCINFPNTIIVILALPVLAAPDIVLVPVHVTLCHEWGTDL